MKKRMTTVIIAVMLMAAMLLTGCMNNNAKPNATPVPNTTVTPVNPPANTDGNVSNGNGAGTDGVINDNNTNNGTGTGTNNGTVGGAIENFVEGMAVELATLPEDIRNAVKKEYPEATIKTVTYATYENQQMYKVTTESGEDKTTEEFYVTADGKIVPVKDGANGTANPSASPKQ